MCLKHPFLSKKIENCFSRDKNIFILSIRKTFTQCISTRSIFAELKFHGGDNYFQKVTKEASQRQDSEN